LLEDFGEDLPPEGHEYASRIIAAAQRMDLLIRDLLEYSRLARAQLDLRPVDLEAVVQDVIRTLEPDIVARSAEVHVAGALPAVIAHRGVLVQVVQNLLVNALKFTAPKVPPRVRVRHERNGEFVRMWVEDEGIGIAAEHQARIFRVFERLHGGETYPGTGIGLAIVRRAIERMGGHVGVESEPGRGSRFWFELPESTG
jgi:signal transduction histidine kinase